MCGKICFHLARSCGKITLMKSWIINFPVRFFREIFNCFKSSRHVFAGWKNSSWLSNGVQIEWHSVIHEKHFCEFCMFWVLKSQQEFLFFASQLRHEQELQQQKLWRDFQEQKKELELQHKMQIESKLQVSLSFDFFKLFFSFSLFWS